MPLFFLTIYFCIIRSVHLKLDKTVNTSGKICCKLFCQTFYDKITKRLIWNQVIMDSKKILLWVGKVDRLSLRQESENYSSSTILKYGEDGFITAARWHCMQFMQKTFQNKNKIFPVLSVHHIQHFCPFISQPVTLANTILMQIIADWQTSKQSALQTGLAYRISG